MNRNKLIVIMGMALLILTSVSPTLKAGLKQQNELRETDFSSLYNSLLLRLRSKEGEKLMRSLFIEAKEREGDLAPQIEDQLLLLKN